MNMVAPNDCRARAPNIIPENIMSTLDTTPVENQGLLREAMNCTVLTRLHQAGVFLAFFSGPFVFPIFGFLLGAPGEYIAQNHSEILAAIAFSISILGPIFISNVLTRKDVVRIADDRLFFQKSGEIKFDEIEQYNVDDYLKLTIRGQRLVMLVQPRRPHGKLYINFLQTFVARIAQYQATHAHSETARLPQRTYFYGSSAASALGGALLFVSVILAIVTIFFLPSSAPKMFIFAMLFPVSALAVVLLTGGRPLQTPEIENSDFTGNPTVKEK